VRRNGARTDPTARVRNVPRDTDTRADWRALPICLAEAAQRFGVDSDCSTSTRSGDYVMATSMYARVTRYTGWGPYWWYDPFYPRMVFVHHRPIVIHRPGRVIISRPPTWHYRAIRDHRR
jgi:hypothetical protein